MLCSLVALSISAAGLPNDFSAVQVDGTTSVMVSWTEITSGATPTGYRIYYQAAGDQMYSTVDIEGSTATEHLLEDLSIDTTYTIRMVARSEHLPSSVTGTELFTIGRYNN